MNADSKPKFSFKINDKHASCADKTPLPVQILTDAGFEPADDYGLIIRTPHGTKVLSSDETVDLEHPQKEFYAHLGGEIFELTVNGHSIFWGEKKIAVAMIRHLANVPHDDELVWQREDAAPEALAVNGYFEIDRRGVEHLRTRNHQAAGATYIYYVDALQFKTNEDSLTGAQITSRIEGWNSANSLVLEGEGNEKNEVIRDTTTVTFKGRTSPAHFTIVPPATFGKS